MWSNNGESTTFVHSCKVVERKKCDDCDREIYFIGVLDLLSCIWMHVRNELSIIVDIAHVLEIIVLDYLNVLKILWKDRCNPCLNWIMYRWDYEIKVMYIELVTIHAIDFNNEIEYLRLIFYTCRFHWIQITILVMQLIRIVLE